MAADQVNLNATSPYKSSPKWTISSRTELAEQKRISPGPGQYKLSAIEDKYERSASWTIGSRYKNAREEREMPGPGKYQPPVTSTRASPKWGFSTAQRPYFKSRGTTPGPGHYDLKSTMEGLSCSISTRSQGSIGISQTPGPGEYKPAYEKSQDNGVRNITFSVAGRYDPSSQAGPGPGKYDLRSTVGDHPMIPNTPKYTIRARHGRLKFDQSPGPGAPATTFK
mmetsp:Transcript_31318/g.73022  ORF Transcript_31318/g.73022 Transcript_31318/m.73022 type:complete len:224 (+) Transcript_31318:124-795(+)